VENCASFTDSQPKAVEMNKFNRNWVWDVDPDNVDIHTVVYSQQDDEDVEAYLGVPTCKDDAPEGGFYGLVVCPGKGNKKRRHTPWIYHYVSQGIVTMTIDVENRGNAITDAVAWIKSDAAHALAPINNDRITLMGYSAGAFSVIDRAFNKAKGDDVYLHIAINGVQEDDTTIFEQGYPILLVQSQNDGMFNGVDGWREGVMPWIKAQNETTHNIKLLAYKLGGHQSIQNGNFFYETHRFMMDPDNYYPPAGDEGDDGEFTTGSNPATWVTKHAELGCLTNDDGIEPIMYMDVWNPQAGELVCSQFCLQTKGCVAIDWFKRLPSTEGVMKDNANCALFAQSCENPTYAGGSHYVKLEDYPHAPNTAFCKPPTPEPPTVPPTPAPTIRDLSACEFDYLEEDEKDCPSGEELASAEECIQVPWDWEWLGGVSQKSQISGCYVQKSSKQVGWNTHENDNGPKSKNFRRLCARCP